MQSTQTARVVAHRILTAEDWTYVPETAEYTHVDGRRGRLAFIGSTRTGDVDDYDVKRVELHQPGRRPTVQELQNRISTAPAPIVVVEF